MTKYKVGDVISDEMGWRSVEEVGRNGEVVFADRDFKDYIIYNKDNDLTLNKNDYRGIVLKLTADKKFKAYSKKYFTSRITAKNYAENEVKKAKPRKLYYRIGEGILSKCDTCNKVFQKSDGCAYCEKNN